jgi:hypothetical protein
MRMSRLRTVKTKDLGAALGDVSHNDGFCRVLLMTVEKAGESRSGGVDLTLSTDKIDWKETGKEFWQSLKGLFWAFPAGLKLTVGEWMDGKPGIKTKTAERLSAHTSMSFLREHLAQILPAYDSCATRQAARFYREADRRFEAARYALARSILLGQDSVKSVVQPMIDAEISAQKSVAADHRAPSAAAGAPATSIR